MKPAGCCAAPSGASQAEVRKITLHEVCHLAPQPGAGRREMTPARTDQIRRSGPKQPLVDIVVREVDEVARARRAPQRRPGNLANALRSSPRKCGAATTTSSSKRWAWNPRCSVDATVAAKTSACCWDGSSPADAVTEDGLLPCPPPAFAAPVGIAAQFRVGCVCIRIGDFLDRFQPFFLRVQQEDTRHYFIRHEYPDLFHDGSSVLCCVDQESRNPHAGAAGAPPAGAAVRLAILSWRIYLPGAACPGPPAAFCWRPLQAHTRPGSRAEPQESNMRGFW